MANQDKLALVANAFAQWRLSRRNRCEKTPQDLRQQAVDLLADYSKAKIISTLKLSGANFKNWIETFSPCPTDSSTSFIPLTLRPLPSTSLNLTLDFTNGNQLRLSGDISAELLAALTQGVQA